MLAGDSVDDEFSLPIKLQVKAVILGDWGK